MSGSAPDRAAAVGASDSTGGEARGGEAGPTVDLRNLGSLAAWTRTTQGDEVFRALCATAGVPAEGFANGGGVVAVRRFAGWLAALHERLGGEGPLLAAGMASEASPPWPPPWMQWFATARLLYGGRVGRHWLGGGTGRIAVRARSLGTAVVRYAAPEPQGRAVCLWRQARLTRRTQAWGLQAAVVRETLCLERGDAACEYVVHWHVRPRWTGAIAAAAMTTLGLVALSVPPGVGWALPALAATLAHAIELRRARAASRATDDAFALAFRRATAQARLALPVEPAVPDAVAEPAPPAASPADGAVVLREGDFWRVTFASKTVLIRHSRGLSLLVHLLRNPDQEIHVSALDALIPSDAVMPVASSAPAEAAIGDLGDAGEVLDAQAKAAYRRRLGELREELEEAETSNDLGRAERLRAELEALTDQLRSATGLGGRSRRASSNADRVRVAVTRRIRAAITQIEKHHPPLAAHLVATIHTGYFCSYGPGAVPWQA